jgi:regulator of replication initiation timing
MSTANFNQQTPTPYGPANTPNNNDGQKRMLTIAGIAIALLLGSVIYLAIGKSNTSKQLADLEMNFEEQKSALADVEAKYNEAVTQLESQKGVNAELDAKINEQLTQLSNQKSDIDRLIREKKNYKNALADMEKQKVQYLAEIDQLKQQVGVLTVDNQRLTTDNQTLTTNLTDTKSQLDQSTAAKAALISEKTQLEAEKTVLSKKVDRGSAIDVAGITVTPIDVRSSGKEREKSRAKRVDKVNICFNTEANEVVDAGEETFHLIIIDPTGAPLLNDALGSGVSTDKKAESDFRFTTTAVTSYQNQETKVCGAWQPGANFVKGNYTVEIYNKGYKVGSSTFKLK